MDPGNMSNDELKSTHNYQIKCCEFTGGQQEFKTMARSNQRTIGSLPYLDLIQQGKTIFSNKLIVNTNLRDPEIGNKDWGIVENPEFAPSIKG